MNTTGYIADVCIDDLEASEADKSKRDYLEAMINYWIANLVRSKEYIMTYRDYYKGVRRTKEFEYLTENFGIGSPSKLGFTSIIRPRINSIVNTMVGETPRYLISCTDAKTIDLIQEEKKNNTVKELVDNYTNSLAMFMAKAKQPTQNPQGEEEKISLFTDRLKENITKIEEKYGQSYVSEFEVAAQSVLRYAENSSDLDLSTKEAILGHDLAITGEAYYREYISKVGADPEIDVLKPENCFYNKNTKSVYVDTIDAFVYREYLTAKDILARYGKFMDAEQKDVLFGADARVRTGRYLRSGVNLELWDEEDFITREKSFSTLDTIEVFHVEWIALNEVKASEGEIDDETTTTEKTKSKFYRQDRYEGVRIGGTVFVNCGKSKHIIRSEDKPYKCGLTYKGVVYNDRDGKPYSMVGALKDIQDVYDLTTFYRQNLIANSGVSGDRVNLAAIPKLLGTNFMDRVLKYVAMKKNGIEIIDPTEPGASLFQHYGSFDNSVNGSSLTAIDAVLAMIEKQADIIVGTSPQFMGLFNERDAASNMKTGISRVSILNEDLFGLYRRLRTMIRTDFINNAKIAYSKGKKASYVLGNRSYIFNIDPNYFSFSDFNIHVLFNSKDALKQDMIAGLGKEFVAANMIDADVIVNVVTSESLTEMKQLVSDGVLAKKKENGQIQQLSSQLQNATDQLKQAQQAQQQYEAKIQQLTAEADKFKQEMLNIRKIEVESKIAISEKTLDATITKNTEEMELKKAAVNLEREQLYMGTGKEKEINNTII